MCYAKKIRFSVYLLLVSRTTNKISKMQNSNQQIISSKIFDIAINNNLSEDQKYNLIRILYNQFTNPEDRKFLYDKLVESKKSDGDIFTTICYEDLKSRLNLNSDSALKNSFEYFFEQFLAHEFEVFKNNFSSYTNFTDYVNLELKRLEQSIDALYSQWTKNYKLLKSVGVEIKKFNELGGNFFSSWVYSPFRNIEINYLVDVKSEINKKASYTTMFVLFSLLLGFGIGEPIPAAILIIFSLVLFIKFRSHLLGLFKDYNSNKARKNELSANLSEEAHELISLKSKYNHFHIFIPNLKWKNNEEESDFLETVNQEQDLKNRVALQHVSRISGEVSAAAKDIDDALKQIAKRR